MAGLIKDGCMKSLSRCHLSSKNPRTIKPGTTSDAMIMNVDFAPTLLDMGWNRNPIGDAGKSFKGTFEDDEKSLRKSVYYHYYEYPIWHQVQPHYGIRTDRYKLILLLLNG